MCDFFCPFFLTGTGFEIDQFMSALDLLTKPVHERHKLQKSFQSKSALTFIVYANDRKKIIVYYECNFFIEN